jgi:hypothetical protein
VVLLNDKNLIPFTERQPREHKELSVKGGKASAKKKRELKSMKEMFSSLLAADAVKRKDLKKLEQYGEDKSNQMLMVISLFELVKEKGPKSVEAFKEISKYFEENGSNEEDRSFNNLIEAIKNVRKTKSKTE